MRALLGAGLCLAAFAHSVAAQDGMGVPPPEASAVVEAPKAVGDEPKFESPTDGTTASLSAGGQFSSGNSRLLAATINSTVDSRFGKNGVGGGILANYGRSATPGTDLRTTAENLQARIRYDRYLLEQMSVFVLNTGRHDRFQGIDFRYNLDPGAKYLFLKSAASSLWLEGGYDLQYDVRRDDALMVMGSTDRLDKTDMDHSARLFAGAKHAFNEKVTFATGVEFLQSFVHGPRNRFNFDALLAAEVGAGLSVGLGFTARYDHAPLPSKHRLDTATTVSLIYAFSNVGKPPEPASCPCPETLPPAAEPAPVAAPPEQPMPPAPMVEPAPDDAAVTGAAAPALEAPATGPDSAPAAPLVPMAP